MTMLVRVVRVAVVTVVVLVAVMIALAAVVRQPTFGAVPATDGPWADAERLRADVERLTTELAPRGWRRTENLGAAAELIAQRFHRAGADVDRQRYVAGSSEQQNVVARFGDDSGPLVVVGAHYDAWGDLPGADDNASGVAGLLELARLLGGLQPPGPVELVAYSTEEPPFFGSEQMGSAVHAAGLAAAGTEVRAMICLEMIGYFTDRQPHHSLVLDLLYPRHGRFVTVAGRWADRALARRVKRAFRGASDLQVVSYSGPTRLGTDLSDHRNYWARGVPAVMVTDTAFLRNPNYHTPGDTADTLDYDAMAGVVDGVLGAVLDLAGAGP